MDKIVISSVGVISLPLSLLFIGYHNKYIAISFFFP